MAIRMRPQKGNTKERIGVGGKRKVHFAAAREGAPTLIQFFSAVLIFATLSMSAIYDNIGSKFLDRLKEVLQGHSSMSADVCVGYVSIRGWEHVANVIEKSSGEGQQGKWRILVGMHRPSEEELRLIRTNLQNEDEDTPIVDGATQAQRMNIILESFRRQLEFGVPSDEAEKALRTLAEQIEKKRVVIKSFLRYPLHAKLYLFKRSNENKDNPSVGFIGSSNLTHAGLLEHGELNVEITDSDTLSKLQKWFDERWEDELAVDLSEELGELIKKSWVRNEVIPPYLIYLKIAYHICEYLGRNEQDIKMPSKFQEELLDFQKVAVWHAMRKLHRYGGVLLGDVVGLGKTVMATAIASFLQEERGYNTLVICPPKLEEMWRRYLKKNQIHGQVLSLGRVLEELLKLPPYRLVIIDESHNLRNREAERYRVIRSYIEHNDSKVLLLTATPFNKHYTDISNQLRLFLDENQDLGIRPERYFQENGKTEEVFPRSLRAFEKSEYPEDWQDLMRLFLIRRTRHFIIHHYAKLDEEKKCHYVLVNGQRHYFPLRQPKCVKFPIKIKKSNPNGQYARLLHDRVVKVIEKLELPRYGLANYLIPNAERYASEEQKRILNNLNRAGKRLIGFCRTNLFKRLESSGYSFLLSIKRHIVRNLIALHALQNRLPLPIGTQDAAMLDTAVNDSDKEFAKPREAGNSSKQAEGYEEAPKGKSSWKDYLRRAAELYNLYSTQYNDRFDWLDAKFFRPKLKRALYSDARSLFRILRRARQWKPSLDTKLQALYELVAQSHPNDKLLIFTQFADTAVYLYEQLRARGVKDEDIAVLTNQRGDPEKLARRFSPSTNGGLPEGETELRVLIATDVLAEGQNLQDAHIVVNYDLPWAIVRLIQRAGRVDRIGQKHDTILVYSFLPDEGVERIIRLRQRLTHRLQQNQEVIGTDDSFFGEAAAARLRDLYTEKAGTLDDEGTDEDIDLESLALQVWRSATSEEQKKALALPPLAFSTCKCVSNKECAQEHTLKGPPGVVAYLRYPNRIDTLIRVDKDGNLVSQSLSAIFREIACSRGTPSAPRHTEKHHELVKRCVEIAMMGHPSSIGKLGSPRTVRRKLWERLSQYRQQLSDISQIEQLNYVLHLIWHYPLLGSAEKMLRRKMRLGISDADLLKLVMEKAEAKSLCEIIPEEKMEPQIICSLGLVEANDKET